MPNATTTEVYTYNARLLGPMLIITTFILSIHSGVISLIKMSGHPPFGIQVMLNGHEWVERQAQKQTISIQKEGNCFTGGSFH